MASYKLVPETDLLRAISALRDAVDVLTVLVERGSGMMQLPASGPTLTNQPKVMRSLPKEDKTRDVKRVVDRVKRGGEKHRPKRFDQISPTISDFVYALIEKDRFSTKEATNVIQPYVVLKESGRDADGQVRNALKKDKRFKRSADNSWLKLAS